MAENQAIEQVLGKLVELLTAKKDEAPSSSKEIDRVQKLELMPVDIKLEGMKNYLAWSRRALLQLQSKKLESFINGETTEPKDKLSSEWKNWKATNALVVTWLFNSMTPTIASSVDTITSASEIWKALESMYSGVGNVMLLADTDDKIHYLKQGERTLMDYVAELKRLWADLDHYDPIELPHPECVAWVKKWVEKKRVLQFLRGLNPEFEGRRAALFHQANLPSLEEAIAAMAQEETRLKVIKGNTLNSPSPAYVVTGSQETRICYNCGEQGHLIRDCSQPLKLNRGRGRGRGMQRGGTSRGGASRGGRVSFRANHAVSDGCVAESVTISPNELDEFRRWKEIGKNSPLNNQETTSSSNFVADAVHSDSGKEDRKKSWSWNMA